MPFTPFHMGPGILIKSLLQGSFSLMVFGWSQIVMDIQPLIAILTGQGKLHGFTHTYVGASLIAVASALTGKHLSEWALVYVLRITPTVSIRWWVVFLSAFVGAFSHVLIDSLMHSDMEPLSPFDSSNELLGLISVAAIHKLCVYSALVGGGIYFVVNRMLVKPASNARDQS